MGYLNLPGGTPSGSDHVLYECPKCKQKKFYWNPTRDLGTCFSAVCAEKTYNLQALRNIMGFVSLSARQLIQKQSEMIRRVAVETAATAKPEETESEWTPAVDSPVALAFLLGEKGINRYHVEQYFSWREDTREVSVQLQCLGVRKKLPRIRRGVDRKGWFVDDGLRKQEFWFEHLDPSTTVVLGKPLILVEGVFDACKVTLPGVHWLACLGTKLYEAAFWRVKQLKPPRVVIWMDPDTAGSRSCVEMMHRIQAGLQIPAHIVRHDAEPGDAELADIERIVRYYCGRV